MQRSHAGARRYMTAAEIPSMHDFAGCVFESCHAPCIVCVEAGLEVRLFAPHDRQSRHMKLEASGDCRALRDAVSV